jgi:mannose-6-phosphate isomerase-like protein (cupin superfamily)
MRCGHGPTMDTGMNETQPVVYGPGEGEHVWGMRACITVKLPVNAAEGGRLSALEFLVPPDFGPPLHVHHEEDEIIQVLEGRLRIVCADTDVIAEPGSFAYLPRGVPHTFWVQEGPARFLVLFTPGGCEAMFVDSGQPADSQRLPEPGAVQSGAMDSFQERHKVEMVGPPLGG